MWSLAIAFPAFWGSQTTFSRLEGSRMYGASSEGAVLGGSFSGSAGSFLVSYRIYRGISLAVSPFHETLTARIDPKNKNTKICGTCPQNQRWEQFTSQRTWKEPVGLS